MGRERFPGSASWVPGGTYYVRDNVEAVKVHGIEASANWSDGPWSISAGASLTHARMEGSGEALFLQGLRPAQDSEILRNAGRRVGAWREGCAARPQAGRSAIRR